MDYEKKYKEALALARSYYDKDSMNTFLDTIFPELRESEDERIRKWLVDYFTEIGENWIHREFTCKQIVAYLEKQKEQKPAEKEHQNNSDAPNESSWSGMISSSNKDKNLDEIAQDYVDGVKEYNPEPTWDLVQTAVCYGYHYCEQKEQKPDDDPLNDPKFLKGFDTGREVQRIFDEKKPAEWNDTDMKEARDNLISVCRDWERGKQTALLPIAAVRARYFLEHLAEPMSAEWSEEDKENLDNIIWLCDNCEKGIENTWIPTQAREIKKLIKSLRPSWKPSEEQMKALKYVAYHILPGEEYRDVLFSLFNDLKKLM